MAQPQQPSDPVDDVVLASSSTGNAEGVQVSLHPLPLLSISEHYTRVRVQNEHDGRKDVRVIGALIGIQQGREVEIVNSFELATNPEGTEVNHDFFVQRQSQFKQVFPTFEFLGWYSIGSRPTALDLAIHTQLLPYNESPLFLQLHPNSHVQGSNLPLSIYESVVDIVAGKSVTKFVKIAGEDGGYRIETGEAERIAVESASRTAVASASTGGRAGQESSESTLVAGLTTQRNAIAMLHSRIEVVLQYLDAVQQGKQAPDHETLRQIASLVSSIASSSTHSSSHSTSTPQPSDFLTEFEREKNDVLLTSLLGQMTRNLEATNTLVDKFSLQQNRDREGDDGGSRMGGRRGIGQGGAGGAVRNKMASGAGAAWRRGGGGAGGGFDFD